MSESIAEMVLPGTYLEVRSEGLISAAAVSTGNLGIVGTASWGPVNQVVALSSYTEALDTFGPADPFVAPPGAPLTLVRTLQLAFAGGARNVWAVRIGDPLPGPASLALTSSKPTSSITLTARQPGTWGNQITVALGKGAASAWTLTLSRGPLREVFSGTGTTIGAVYDAIKAPNASRLVSVGDPPADVAATFNEVTSATPLARGVDGALATGASLAQGLALLEDQPVNIVLIGGMGAGDPDVHATVAVHLEATENAGRERIAVLGATTSDAAATTPPGVLKQAGDYNDDRVVLVAPGLVAADAATGAPVALPPPYLAAVIAGSLCSLAPHASLTNRALPIDRLDVNYPAGLATQLLQARVTVVRHKLGDQVVKAITTDAGAFGQITVRRIVDYAKTGVRSGADPYIGKLNNARVRAALKATLDGFLSQMVLDEMLVSYQLDVTASRAQEIQGIAAVTMTLQPTFSIDFIRVTITLQ